MVLILTRPEDSGAVGAGCEWGIWTRGADAGCGRGMWTRDVDYARCGKRRDFLKNRPSKRSTMKMVNSAIAIPNKKHVM